MTTTASKDLERLEREFARKRLEVRSDPSLSWERKERQIKALTEEHYQKRKELESEAA